MWEKGAVAKKQNKANKKKKLIKKGVPIVAQCVKNSTNTHEDANLIPGLTQWVKDLVLP